MTLDQIRALDTWELDMKVAETVMGRRRREVRPKDAGDGVTVSVFNDNPNIRDGELTFGQLMACGAPPEYHGGADLCVLNLVNSMWSLADRVRFTEWLHDLWEARLPDDERKLIEDNACVTPCGYRPGDYSVAALAVRCAGEGEGKP